jgi:hypothetical protein
VGATEVGRRWGGETDSFNNDYKISYCDLPRLKANLGVHASAS